MSNKERIISTCYLYSYLHICKVIVKMNHIGRNSLSILKASTVSTVYTISTVAKFYTITLSIIGKESGGDNQQKGINYFSISISFRSRSMYGHEANETTPLKHISESIRKLNFVLFNIWSGFISYHQFLHLLSFKEQKSMYVHLQIKDKRTLYLKWKS